MLFHNGLQYRRTSDVLAWYRIKVNFYVAREMKEIGRCKERLGDDWVPYSRLEKAFLKAWASACMLGFGAWDPVEDVHWVPKFMKIPPARSITHGEILRKVQDLHSTAAQDLSRYVIEYSIRDKHYPQRRL
jgi:hypothetical protein